ncbi:MAG: patatin-like phospholipase family protein, partial [Betaproteobacteria bacterium]|nr:patatin-like phospholipase family protein [Betaproteobacteria bacterium]
MGADVVIAVDVSWFAQARNAENGPTARDGRGGRYALLAEELDTADVVITPRTVRTRMLDFERKTANIAAGEEAAREAVLQIRGRLQQAALRKQGRMR